MIWVWPPEITNARRGNFGKDASRSGFVLVLFARDSVFGFWACSRTYTGLSRLIVLELAKPSHGIAGSCGFVLNPEHEASTNQLLYIWLFK